MRGVRLSACRSACRSAAAPQQRDGEKVNMVFGVAVYQNNWVRVCRQSAG